MTDIMRDEDQRLVKANAFAAVVRDHGLRDESIPDHTPPFQRLRVDRLNDRSELADVDGPSRRVDDILLIRDGWFWLREPQEVLD
jgi:hypothetical protein